MASRSPRRRQLLRQMGIHSRVLRPSPDEDAEPALSLCQDGIKPPELALARARNKVRTVKHRVRSGIIIGADTVVALHGTIFGKPGNRDEARQMLDKLSGRTHEVTTALCLLVRPENREIVGVSTTKVKFRKLGPEEIESYTSTPEPYDKAGAYGIQGKAGVFVERIEGDYFNIVGLPIALLHRLLRRSAT
ncbi:MAG: Maf family protein [candidate division WOR-3 bacterium]